MLSFTMCGSSIDQDNSVRIVVDTNVGISGLLWKGLPTEILRLAETRHIEICSTTAIVTELERVLE